MKYDAIDDKIKDECGVFAILSIEEAACYVPLGLNALQHRGQEAAGIASVSEEGFHTQKYLGRVEDKFSRQKVLNRLPGNTAMGHVRYSTNGGNYKENIQPISMTVGINKVVIAHNGNFSNSYLLRQSLVQQNQVFQTSSDSELLIHLFAKEDQKLPIVERFINALKHLEGGYCLIMFVDKEVFVARDCYGIRPMVLGIMAKENCLDEREQLKQKQFKYPVKSSIVLASESCSFDIINAKLVRDVQPGEVMHFHAKEDGSGYEVSSYFPFEDKAKLRNCAFEFIYFARADSVIDGRSVYEIRKNLGKELAKENREFFKKLNANFIVPVPETSMPISLGLAEELAMPIEFAITKNNYIGRTFIEPHQTIRKLGVKLKLNPNKILLKGKDIIVIDDSLVRGTTAKKLVEMLREVGVKHITFCLASPPVRYTDYYGIDIPLDEDLLYFKYNQEEKVAEYIGADYVKFLSIDGLYKAFGYETRNDEDPQLTDHYFTGQYIVAVDDFIRVSSSEDARSRISSAVGLPLFYNNFIH